MHSKIDVSVIIPVFNAQATIGYLVHELLSEQTLSIEVIIVDDGSADETSTILSTIEDERLVVISQQNLGVYAARNAALAVHRGEWVVFLDADDRIEEGFLRERLKSARAAQADVALFNGWHTDSSDLQRRPVHHKQPYAQALSGHAWIQHCVAQKEWPHYLWLQMIRSSYIRKNNLRFQAGKSHKDILWTINLATSNCRFYISDRKDYFYITNPVSITHRQDYYDIRAHSYIDVISDILALSSLPQHHEIRTPLRRHALVECRHFLGLYRRKIANRQAARMEFRQRIALRQLITGVGSLSDVFFVLKLVRKIYL